MLSYRHIFHAGNFADVFKHALLTRLLSGVSVKEKPYVYLDTHAGIGRYDLTHPWAQKAREYENGIARVWRAKDAPPELEPYLDSVRALNPHGTLRWYPGSPLIARQFMRGDDRMVLVELNKVDYAELKAVFEHERRVAVQLMDAYQALKAYLPPPERRGLVLVDSSFDRTREFDRIVKALKEAHARWSTGMYAVWYPIMEPAPMRDFAADIQRSGIRKVLRLEITVRERDETAIIPGCGMLVVNPPWRFDKEAHPIVEWLAKKLVVSGEGHSQVDWLVPE
ncbi:MAG: Ribosomal large subunit methyltransferase [Betaproteobacteria bacterium]|jgi:23S rRNA (adenine2030-N6)-methyltransferase|nr:Ribosomal large subunit methyltransferase [Betaproteobacteria bacterium]